MQSLNELFSLDGQTAVVTGGGGGLGSAMAHALALAGARVVVLGLRPEPARRVADALVAAGHEALALSCDLLDQQALERARREIAAFGPVEILVNAAGGNRPEATTSA